MLQGSRMITSVLSESSDKEDLIFHVQYVFLYQRFSQQIYPLDGNLLDI